MGFMKPIAKVGTLGLASQLFGKKKKKSDATATERPMMTLTNRSVDRPTSMIGGRY